jgi:hypothetical protein
VTNMKFNSSHAVALDARTMSEMAAALAALRRQSRPAKLTCKWERSADRGLICTRGRGAAHEEVALHSRSPAGPFPGEIATANEKQASFAEA